MKKIVLCFSISFLLPVFFLQGKGVRDEGDDKMDLTFLVGAENARFVLDFSEAVILGVEADEFKASESEWETGIVEVTNRFVSAFNSTTSKGIHPFRLGTTLESDLTAVLKIFSVTKKGSRVDALFDIYDKTGNVLFSREAKAEEGRYGSTMNLMGDAMEEIGKSLGKDLGNPLLDNKGFKERLSLSLKNGERIAIHVEVLDRCSLELRSESIVRKMDEDQKARIEKTIYDSFLNSLRANNKIKIQDGQVLLGNEDSSENILFVYLISYPTGGIHYHELLTDFKLSRNGKPVACGQYSAKASKSNKKQVEHFSEQLESIGAELASFK